MAGPTIDLKLLGAELRHARKIRGPDLQALHGALQDPAGVGGGTATALRRDGPRRTARRGAVRGCDLRWVPHVAGADVAG